MATHGEALATAAELMTAFAERTGLASGRPPRRYLWTDAFAVCNLLGLARSTGDGRHADLALRLVDQVHRGLGRHRPDDARSGWLGGLGEEEGALHPTRGGLRIGKPLPERRADEPFDERLEWERDGQYFHYLTKWMHALDQVAGTLRQPRFNLWARELAAAAHAAFVHGPPGRRRMAWKMSIDLARPLVPSMGQHDPLDGTVTCVQLETTAALLPGTSGGPDLAPAIRDFSEMSAATELGTADPLGLGGLLTDAFRVGQLAQRGAFGRDGLLARLLAAAEEGLALHARLDERQQPAARRLGFRELGLAIGLSALELLHGRLEADGALAGAGTRARLASLRAHRALGDELVSFWLAPEHRRSPTWTEHRDINDVMLATSLVPEGFLVLAAE